MLWSYTSLQFCTTGFRGVLRVHRLHREFHRLRARNVDPASSIDLHFGAPCNEPSSFFHCSRG